MRRRVLGALDRFQPWAAWGLVIGGAVTFVGVLVNVISTGVAKPATLLISADLFVSGYAELRAYADEEDDG